MMSVQHVFQVGNLDSHTRLLVFAFCRIGGATSPRADRGGEGGGVAFTGSDFKLDVAPDKVGATAVFEHAPRLKAVVDEQQLVEARQIARIGSNSLCLPEFPCRRYPGDGAVSMVATNATAASDRLDRLNESARQALVASLSSTVAVFLLTMLIDLAFLQVWPWRFG